MKFSLDLSAIRATVDADPTQAGRIYNTFTDHWRSFIEAVDEAMLHKHCPAAQEMLDYAGAAKQLIGVFEAANQTKAAEAMQVFRSTVIHKYNELPSTH